jgi:hypothetical protein
MSASGTKRTFRRGIGSTADSACHFFIIIVIGHETTAAAPWALLLIVRTLFNDAITIAVWTSFHVCLPVDTFASLAPYPT